MKIPLAIIHTDSIGNIAKGLLSKFILAVICLSLSGCNQLAVADRLSANPKQLDNCKLASDYWRPGGSGTGGTGQIADRGLGGTGIIGVITDFGSICINGQKIDHDATSIVKIDGVDASSDALRRGQFASVYAVTSPRGLTAKSIGITHALEGPLTDIDTVRDTLSVLGITVKWNAETYFMEDHDNPINPSSLKRDDILSVSGFWKSPNLVIATRINKITDNDHVGASGTINQVTTEGFMINRIPVRLTRPDLISEDAEGRTAYISGDWTGSEILADLVDVNLPTPHSDRAQRLNLEGYIDEIISKDQLKMLGTVKVTINDKTEFLDIQGSLKQGMRVWVHGPIDQQKRLVAEQIRIIH